MARSAWSAQIVRDGQELGRNCLPFRAPGIEPEKLVAGHAGLGVVEILLRGHQFLFGCVDFAARVEMEDLTVGVLVIGDGTFARLPRGDRAKEHAVPIHVEETFAIVVPHRGERAGRPKTLPGAIKP